MAEEFLTVQGPENVGPLESRIEGLSNMLSEDIQSDDPYDKLLDEVLTATGVNPETLQFDPSIQPTPPSRAAFEGVGISTGRTGTEVQGPPEPPGILERAGEVTGDVAETAAGVGLMTIRGALEVVPNAASTLTDIGNAVDQFVQSLLPEAIRRGAPIVEGDEVFDKFMGIVDTLVRRPEGQVEQTVKDISQIIVGMAPTVKALTALGLSTQAAGAFGGAIAEAVAVDPDDPGIIDAIGLLSPGLRDTIKEFISSNLPESEAEETFKRRLVERGYRAVTDGLVADGIWTIFGKIIKSIRHGFQAKKAASQATGEAAPEIFEFKGQPKDLFQEHLETVREVTAPPKTILDDLLEQQARRGGPLTTTQVDEAFGISPVGRESTEAMPTSLTIRPTTQVDDVVLEGELLPDNLRLDVPPETIEGEIITPLLTAGGAMALAVGANIITLDKSENELRDELTTAGIGFDTFKFISNVIKKLTRREAGEKVAKEVGQQQETLLKKKKLVKDGEPIIEEVTEEVRQKAGQFIADQPEEVVIQGKVRGINFDHIDTPDKLRESMDRVSQLFEPEIEAARRMGTSRQAEAALAREMGLTVDQLHTFANASEILPKMAVATREMLVASTKRLNKLRDAVLAGDKNAHEAYLQQMLIQGEIQQSVAKVRSEIGRSLGMYNVDVDGSIKFEADVIGRARAAKKGTGKTVEDLAKMHKMLETNDPKAARQFERQLANPSVGGAVFEHWVNGILSAATGRNVLGNAFNTFVLNPLEHAERGVHGLAERNINRLTSNIGLGKVVEDPVQDRIRSAFGMYKAMWNAQADAWALMWRSLATGEQVFGDTKIGPNTNPQITRDLLNFENNPGFKKAVGIANKIPGVDISPDSWAGGFLNFYGKALRTAGGGLLRATDDAFKILNLRAELHAAAETQAIQQGLRGEAKNEFIQNFMNKPPDDALEAAMKQAQVLTFSNALSDPEASFQMLRSAAQGFEVAAAKEPRWRYIVPFVKAATNIPTFALERAPIIQLASSTFRKGLKSPDPRIRAQTWAKVSTSASMLGLATVLSQNGLLIGPGPTDARLKKQLEDTYNIQFNSLKIGNKWIPLDRDDPFGWFMSSAAALAEHVIGNPAIPEEEQNSLLGALLVTNGQMLAQKGYMYMPAMIMDAMSGGKFSQGKLADAEAISMNMLASFLPFSAALSRANRAFIDPYKREWNELLDPIKSRIPFWSKTLPAQVSSAGEDVYHTHGYGLPGVIEPFAYFVFGHNTKNVKQHPAVNLLLKHKLKLPYPGNMVAGFNIADEDANPWWVHRYRKLNAREVKLGGRNLLESIVEVSKKPIWKQLSDGPEGGKQLIIDQLRRVYEQAARSKLLDEFPELRQQILETRREKIQGLRR